MVNINERKQTEEALRERASLLDLTHDSVFVRDMNDMITYWNRGAAELYGWSKEEAVGQVSHQLTRTIFPAFLEGINEELLRTGRWEGELTHTKRDGTQLVVASRWSLQRDEHRTPLAILETNNDGDRIQLQQVLLNLIINGIEAMGTVGDRPRKLGIMSRRHDPERVLVAVDDSGDGIDAQSSNRIFDAFFTTKRDGLGMGLSISRTIVEAHGGRLWAIPNHGPGATFQFTLPTSGDG